MSTTVVRLDAEIVEAVKIYCEPTKAQIGHYMNTAIKTQLVKDKAADKFIPKLKKKK